MDDAQRIHTSRFLSLVLRHRPDRIGLVLDAAGWTDVDDLLARCAENGVPLDRAGLDLVVARCDKQRFAFSDCGRRIRANQGHSLQVELEHERRAPPEELFHGTHADALTAIRRDGLRRMRRHHVHLSPDPRTAARVGGRRGPAVVLRVRASAMHADGHTFRVAANGVWLTDVVPPAYLVFPTD